MQRGADHFGRVQNAHRQHVAVFAGGGVVALVAFEALRLVQHHGALDPGIGRDLRQRRVHGPGGDGDAHVLILVVALHLGHGAHGAHQGDPAAGHNAFLDRGAGGVQRVFHAGLLLLHLHLGGGADLDDGHAAGQLGQALLQLLAVIVRRGVFDLLANLLDAAFDVGLGAGPIDDGGVLLGGGNPLGGAQVVQAGAFQGQADLFRDHRAAGQDGDVLQHGLAPVPEAGRLGRGHLDDASHVVHHQGGQGFAFDVFGDDHQGLAGLGDILQQREHVPDVGDFLVAQQDVGVFQLGRHGFLIVDEVGGQIAAIELHAFHHIQLVLQAAAFLHGDDAFAPHLVHGFGDDLAHGGVAVGGNAAHLSHFLGGFARLGHLADGLHGGGHGLVDAALEIHGVHARGNGFQALGEDALRQHGGRGGAVAGFVGGLAGHLLDHLGAHVLELVLEFDFLGHGDAVLGDRGGAEGFVEHHVAALGAESDSDGIGQNVHALEHAAARVVSEFYVFRAHCLFPQFSGSKG